MPVTSTDCVYFFVPHRSGSSFCYGVCKQLADAVGLTLRSPNDPATGLSLADALERPDMLADRGVLYGPLRAAAAIPAPQDSRIIVQLRDPRDVLVSMFYSYCFYHSGEVEGGTGYRKDVADAGIDAFVLNLAGADERPYPDDCGTGLRFWLQIGNLSRRYNALLDLVDSYPRNTLFLTYEQMVRDPHAWTDRVLDWFGLDNPDLKASLNAPKRRPSKGTGDKFGHVRAVQPGDHEGRLKPETLASLDILFQRYFEHVSQASADA